MMKSKQDTRWIEDKVGHDDKAKDKGQSQKTNRKWKEGPNDPFCGHLEMVLIL